MYVHSARCPLKLNIQSHWDSTAHKNSLQKIQKRNLSIHNVTYVIILRVWGKSHKYKHNVTFWTHTHTHTHRLQEISRAISERAPSLFWRLCSYLTCLSLCCCAVAYGPNMALTLRACRAEYHFWCSDWLKQLGWLAGTLLLCRNGLL